MEVLPSIVGRRVPYILRARVFSPIVLILKGI